MSDDFKREERVEKREEPGRVGAIFVKYAFITVIILIILFFIANYLLPMIPGGGEGEAMGSRGDSTVIELNGEVDLNDEITG